MDNSTHCSIFTHNHCTHSPQFRTISLKISIWFLSIWYLLANKIPNKMSCEICNSNQRTITEKATKYTQNPFSFTGSRFQFPAAHLPNYSRPNFQLKFDARTNCCVSGRTIPPLPRYIFLYWKIPDNLKYIFIYNIYIYIYKVFPCNTAAVWNITVRIQ